MSFKTSLHVAAAAAFIGFTWSSTAQATANSLPGAINVTQLTCTTVNGNLFASKDDVYIKPSASGNGSAVLPNGTYYVRVSDPSTNTPLSASPAPMVTVASGQINGHACIQLSSVAPYADTPNQGGEYKVSFSTLPDFSSNVTKTDNFKVRSVAPPPASGQITVYKFYDANADGFYNDPAAPITGWQVGYDDQTAPSTAVFGQLLASTYTVFENEPIGNSIKNSYAWVATNAYEASSFAFTGPTAGTHFNQIGIDLGAGADRTVYFGNVCIGPNGGGKTLGYWSNKNGQADLSSQIANYTAALSQLNLKTPTGGNFDPTSYNQLRTWLLNGNAVNMAYMLSVQLAALDLSVLTSKLSPLTMVYAPNVPEANPAGFMSIGKLIDTANQQLGSYPTTYAGFPQRAVQEALKNAIDDINNNRASVAQPDGSHCPALAFP